MLLWLCKKINTQYAWRCQLLYVGVKWQYLELRQWEEKEENEVDSDGHWIWVRGMVWIVLFPLLCIFDIDQEGGGHTPHLESGALDSVLLPT